MKRDNIPQNTKELLETIFSWQRDVFKFTADVFGKFPSECKEEMKGAEVTYTDEITGEEITCVLFDKDGKIVHDNYKAYSRDDFKDQYDTFDKKNRYSWQQTLSLTAYQRALETFDSGSFDTKKRFVSIVSGHGTGKTHTLSVISLHFLFCYFGAQAGMTSVTDAQVSDIYMKELYKVKSLMPVQFQNQIEMVDGMVRMKGEKDWFLRARVARPERPEALAGLHGKYVLIIVDEASGVPEATFETMKGALTEGNFVVIYTSNGTQAYGEFYDSHKPGAPYTQLQFSSEDSPFVTKEYVKGWADKYGRESAEFLIRVQGGFPNEGVLDDKGWVQMFANINIMFEPDKNQGFTYPVLGIDPAGAGKDQTKMVIRDDFYLKEIYSEDISNEKQLARVTESFRDVYNLKSRDIGIDAFGIGARLVGAINTAIDDNVFVILADKPREGTESEFASFKAEMAWRFREWLIKGGIIITDNPVAWRRVLEKILFRRANGKIQLQPKHEFKKRWGFSPDLFDAGVYTFFKEFGTRPIVYDKNTRERMEHEAWMLKNGIASGDNSSIDDLSSV